MKRILIFVIILLSVFFSSFSIRNEGKYIVKFASNSECQRSNQSWDELSSKKELSGSELIRINKEGAVIIAKANESSSYAIFSNDSTEAITMAVSVFFQRYLKENSNQLRQGTHGTYSGMGKSDSLVINNYFNCSLDSICLNGIKEGIQLESHIRGLESDIIIANNTNYPLFLSVIIISHNNLSVILPDSGGLLKYTDAHEFRKISGVKLNQVERQSYSMYAIGSIVPFAIDTITVNNMQELRIVVRAEDKYFNWYISRIDYK